MLIHGHFNLGVHAGLESFHRGKLNDHVVLHDVARPPYCRRCNRSYRGNFAVQRPVWQCNSGRHPQPDMVNHRIVNADLDLHLRRVRHQQQHLIIVHRCTLCDIGRPLPVFDPWVNYQAASLGPDDTAIDLLPCKSYPSLIHDEDFLVPGCSCFC